LIEEFRSAEIKFLFDFNMLAIILNYKITSSFYSKVKIGRGLRKSPNQFIKNREKGGHVGRNDLMNKGLYF